MSKLRCWFEWIWWCYIGVWVGFTREHHPEWKLSWITWKALNPNVFPKKNYE